jgi:MFS family permease
MIERSVDQPPDRPSAAYKWWVVAMLWLVCFLNYADRQAIYSVFPTLEKEFGFNKVEQGLIGSAFMWVYAAAAPLAGYIGDRVRRKDLILGGCLFWSLITGVTAWCQRLWQFVAVRALEGFGETFYFPASMSLVSDYHSPRTRSRAMALHQSSVYAGTIAGSWIGAWCAQQYNWRVGFYGFGAAGVIAALLLYRLLREPHREMVAEPIAPQSVGERPGFLETLHAILRTPTAALLMFAFLGANFVATIFLTWTPTFLVEKFHYQIAAAGLTGAVYIHLASAASVPVSGMLADRLARRFRGGRVLVQAGALLLGSFFVFRIGWATDVDLLIAAMIGFGVCKGLYDANIFASLYDVVPAHVRATAAGVMNTVGWGGGALGPIYVGWMAEHGRHDSTALNMSDAIAYGGVVYIAAGVVLLVALALLSRARSPGT